MVFYNDIDPFVAQWIRNLIAAGHIPPGIVDGRSIEDLELPTCPRPTQCHFFAGIGGWAHALKLAGLRSAGWADDQEVWTGSCPCQPFSIAGRKRGQKDSRHLWPAWFRLIDRHRPSVIFGEQVASPDGLRWLDLVSADLEGAGYSFGAANLCAAGVGAPHIRQRLYFVGIDRMAIADKERRNGIGVHLSEWESSRKVPEATGRSAIGGLAHPADRRSCGQDGPKGGPATRRGPVSVVGDTSSERGRRDSGAVPRTQEEGAEGWESSGDISHQPIASGASDSPLRGHPAGLAVPAGLAAPTGLAGLAALAGPWSDVVWLPCTDGKLRPTESGIFPLADGISGRLGRLRAYGNAIVPQVAAVFIRAVMDCLFERPDSDFVLLR
jgi:DNA (cytosine-5)-methyltransferase 1